MTMLMGRVPIWFSRENKAATFTLGVMFQFNEAVPAFRLSCCVKYWTPATPGSKVPATALFIVLEIVLTVGVTLHALVPVRQPQTVLNHKVCSAGFTFQTPAPPENSVRVVPLKRCGVSSKRNCNL